MSIQIIAARIQLYFMKISYFSYNKTNYYKNHRTKERVWNIYRKPNTFKMKYTTVYIINILQNEKNKICLKSLSCLKKIPIVSNFASHYNLFSVLAFISLQQSIKTLILSCNLRNFSNNLFSLRERMRSNDCSDFHWANDFLQCQQNTENFKHYVQKQHDKAQDFVHLPFTGCYGDDHSNQHDEE